MRASCTDLGIVIRLAAMTSSARLPYRAAGTLRLLVCAMLLAACSPTTAPRSESASLVITNARVWTGDADKPWAEAVASKGENIIAVGSSADIAPLIGDDTEVIVADGGMLVPGFIDPHVHFLVGGSSIASVQLRDANSPQEFTQRIADFAKSSQPGEWITGGTWDHTNWGGELPRREWIDAVTPDNPVWVARLDGHMALANSVALDLAGVDADTPDVSGRGDRARRGEQANGRSEGQCHAPRHESHARADGSAAGPLP